MIKGITLISAVASGGVFDRLTSLFAALGFEQGKGWQDATGRGEAFLAPIGNLEFVTGRAPAPLDFQTPPILIEVNQLDHLHSLIENWLLTDHRPEEIPALLSAPDLTHWNSRLFTIQLTPELKLGFWQSENLLHNQPSAIEGDLSAAGMRFAVVSTRWNTVITDRLLQGALDALHRSGAAKTDIEIVRVPGAWEIPSAARTLAESKGFDAIVTLGCLLRGETAHYEAIYNEVARGIGQSQQETGIPHAFGVLTCETLEQALDRAGLKAGNKGFEAAMAAIEMVSLQRKLAAQNPGVPGLDSETRNESPSGVGAGAPGLDSETWDRQPQKLQAGAPQVPGAPSFAASPQRVGSDKGAGPDQPSAGAPSFAVSPQRVGSDTTAGSDEPSAGAPSFAASPQRVGSDQPSPPPSPKGGK